LRNQDVIFDSYTSNGVVVLQEICVDVFRILGIL
jgi:hypothetical protein